MGDNNWKQKSLNPTLLNETDDSFSTVLDLQNAIKDDDILNIAVTGPYGSGKSSVLRTFQKYAGQDVKILDISLATLDADDSLFTESTDESYKKNKANADDKQIHEQKELLNRKIEYSILQQLVYRKTLEALPYSRMKKIRHFSPHTIRSIAAYTIGFVICLAFALKLSVFQIPLLYKSLNIPINIQDAISIISVLFCLVIAYEILKYFIKNFGGLRPEKVSVRGNEIDMHDDGSIFNRYLEEILYFFQCTNYNVVIIEDLDRFNTTDIFLKLRELNHLINKSEMVGRTVKFIYAVKDDMFKDSSRSKFFDYITTVIPVITTSNSKDKLKKALNELGHDGEVSDEDIRDIAFYIDDMRLLYNIANEYHQYSQRLNNKEHPLEAKKLLAMITVKNYHPHDFSDLHNRKGKLYDAISQKMKHHYIDFAINTHLANREKLAKNKLEAYDASCHLSIKELRLLYLYAIVSNISQNVNELIIDGQIYKISDIARNDGLFEKIITGKIVSYRFYDNYYRKWDEGELKYNFSTIEKEVNPNFTYHERVSPIRSKRTDLETEIKEIELEKKKVAAYTISELIEKFNIYEDNVFKAIGLSDLEEDFIRRGFIAEDYNDYINYFYPEIMSLADHQLCLDIKLNRKTEYDTTIDNVELLLQELPSSAFRYVSVWNFHILDFLVEHCVLWKDYYELFISNLVENDSGYFFYTYSNNSNNAMRVFAECMLRQSDKMWEKAVFAKEQERNSIFKFWFVTCKVSDIHKQQIKWINENFDVLASFYEELSIEVQEFLSHNCNYESLLLTDSKMLKEVVNNGCYVLNEQNAPIIVNVKEAKDDITKLDGLDEMKYALRQNLLSVSLYNVNEYLKQCDYNIDEILAKYIEDHIQDITKNADGHDDEYDKLFQTLLEHNGFSETIYKHICEVNNSKLSVSSAILSLSQLKLLMLINANAFEYNSSTLTSLNNVSTNLSCAYMVFYREKLSEMLQENIMSTQLAEKLLYNGSFNLSEYQEIIAALSPSNVTMSQPLANKICELMSIQYSTCVDSLLFDAIKLCTNRAHTVTTVARKIHQSGFNHSTINDLLSLLPKEYHVLMDLYKQPKFEDNSYNKLLIDTLKTADYISSYKIDNDKIKVVTKHK